MEHNENVIVTNPIRESTIYQYALPAVQIVIPALIILFTIIKLLKKDKEANAKYVIKRFVLAAAIFLLGTLFSIFSSLFTSAKPIIYFYPEKDMDIEVTLGHPDKLSHTYPKYDNKWDITVYKNGNIYDKKTKRNYYALYWEGINDKNGKFKEGFVIEGKETTKFLEEKLSILGLNDKEINEFIIYWLPQMENNKYNLIRFASMEEINEIMPLKFSVEPDTLIRVYMKFKPINKKINIKEQELERVERHGFTVVEWGGSKLK